MGKALLFITSRLPWPVDSGRKTSINYYCKGLHDLYGYDVYLYSFLEKGQTYDGTHPEYIKDVYIADEISKSEKIINLLTKTLLFNDWPIQCSLYYSNSNIEKIREVCRLIKPEVVFTEMIRTAGYISAFKDDNIKSIANLDDMLSKRYLRQIMAKNSKASVAGAYSGKLPYFVNKFINNKLVRNFFLSFEARRCKKWEKIYYREYDYCMFTSKIETDEMNKIMGDFKAVTLSVGIDYDYFSREILKLEKEVNSLSFLGNFKVAANIDSLKMICDDILPRIKHEFKLYVIGSCPEEIKHKYESDRIVFTGRVDDLTEYVRRTEIFLSPIAYGTGIKTKIVEAMAMGMPVITNDVGAEGISAVPGYDFIVENDINNSARIVDELLADNNRKESIGKRAQRFAYENYRWDLVYKAFEKVGL